MRFSLVGSSNAITINYIPLVVVVVVDDGVGPVSFFFIRPTLLLKVREAGGTIGSHLPFFFVLLRGSALIYTPREDRAGLWRCV